MMRKATFVQFYPMVAVALALVVGIVVGGRSSGDVSPWAWLWVAVGGVAAAVMSRSLGSIATGAAAKPNADCIWNCPTSR